MHSTDRAKPSDKAWVKPVCAVTGVALVCGTSVYLVNKTGGAEMFKALAPALSAVALLAK